MLKRDRVNKLGYARSPPLEEAVMSHLCLSCGLKFASLPSKPCRTKAHIVEKVYIAPGYAASVLQTMAILRVFQMRLLKSLDEEGLDPESFCKLCTAVDLALCSAKQGGARC